MIFQVQAMVEKIGAAMLLLYAVAPQAQPVYSVNMVKNIDGRSRSALPLTPEFEPVGDTLFFTASSVDDATFRSVGQELWKTNGELEFTERVAVMNGPRMLTAAGNKLYFLNYTTENGEELWTSDGSEQGTFMVKDLVPGPDDADITSMVAVGSAFYFIANADPDFPVSLYVTDGTDPGTTQILAGDPAMPLRNVSSLTLYKSELYFAAFTPSTGTVIWHTDGTTAGTVPASDVTFPQELVPSGDLLFFRASNTLFATDGTLENTIDLGLLSPSLLTNVNGILFFRGNANGLGNELYASRGTLETTGLVKDILP
ncbi:MAG: hypothetical protein RBU21_22065, partial [FCB group bacterium]|nr:hypothetical protein [FCB group bacterium]